MKFKLTTGLLALAGLFIAAKASAASLQMYPVTINFCNREPVTAVYVKNTGEGSIGAQLRVYKWQQQGQKEVLTPDSTLIVSPPIATIPPGKEQLVRIVSTAPVVSDGPEQSWRLLVDELPDSTHPQSRQQVHFLMRYSVPIFFSCPGQTPALSALHASLDKRSHRLVIRNSGSHHLKLSNVSMTAAGKNHLITKGLLGYVLPGSEMAWDLPKNMPAGTSLTASLSDNAIRQTIPISR